MIGLYVLALVVVAHAAGGSGDKPRTGTRNYELAAQAAASGQPNDAAQSAGGANVGPLAGSYRLSGEKSLQPARIGDDGVHMYLEWSEEQALPAVFALNDFGEEEMVDGYMRQGIFTIDRVYAKLVFRIGRKRARAERVNK